MARIKGKLRIREAADAMRDGTHDGVGVSLDHILQVSNTRVPLEEGPLMDSGRVEHAGNRGLVTYDSVYAARQHEELTWRHSAGRMAKYLEVTLQTEAAIVRRIVGAQIRRQLKITAK